MILVFFTSGNFNPCAQTTHGHNAFTSVRREGHLGWPSTVAYFSYAYCRKLDLALPDWIWIPRLVIYQLVMRYDPHPGIILSAYRFSPKLKCKGQKWLIVFIHVKHSFTGGDLMIRWYLFQNPFYKPLPIVLRYSFHIFTLTFLEWCFDPWDVIVMRHITSVPSWTPSTSPVP